jgi:hypothetical protein
LLGLSHLRKKDLTEDRYKNYRCSSHNKFFELNIYEKDPVNKQHWRANIARPAGEIVGITCDAKSHDTFRHIYFSLQVSTHLLFRHNFITSARHQVLDTVIPRSTNRNNCGISRDFSGSSLPAKLLPILPSTLTTTHGTTFSVNPRLFKNNLSTISAANLLENEINLWILLKRVSNYQTLNPEWPHASYSSFSLSIRAFKELIPPSSPSLEFPG